MSDKTLSIAVFGEALVDDFVTEQVVGGAPFNVARHLAGFGAAPLMITRIGRDRNGAMVEAEFGRFGMTRDGLQIDAARPTGQVRVECGADGHRFVIEPDQAYDHIDARAALAACAGASPATIYFGTLAQRGATSRAALEQVLQAGGATRYLDLNLRDGQVDPACVQAALQWADIVKVNEDEWRGLLAPGATAPGATAPGAAPQHSDCAELLRRFSLQGLIVTLGPHGSVYCGADGAFIVSGGAAAAPGAGDTVGAGDAFSALFLLGRGRGWPLAATLARANQFAGAVCAVRGAVAADGRFHERWLARWLAH